MSVVFVKIMWKYFDKFKDMGIIWLRNVSWVVNKKGDVCFGGIFCR